MDRPRDGTADWLRALLGHPGAAYALGRASFEHKRVEAEFRRRILDLCPPDVPLEFPHLALPLPEYFQRNFFSIFFLSVFRALGICRRRRTLYGLVLHGVRGMVTATDNILDGQSQGAVRIGSVAGRVMPNVLLTILQEGLVLDAVRELSPNADSFARSRRLLTRALFAIAGEEGREEEAIEEVLTPAVLLDTVHSFRGGRLLQLAFVVPEALEPDLAEPMAAVKCGVNRLGLALQILDDVTDFAEDVAARNHNILRSWVVHAAPDGACSDEDLAGMAPHALQDPEIPFPLATGQVLSLAVELAVSGFDHIGRVGHPVGREAAPELIRLLFRLRGLARLWDLSHTTHAAGQPVYLPWAVSLGGASACAVCAGRSAALHGGHA